MEWHRAWTKLFVEYRGTNREQTGTELASFTKEVNPRLAKRPLVFKGRLADGDLTSLGGTAAQHCHTKPSDQLHINDKLDLASFKKFI